MKTKIPLEELLHDTPQNRSLIRLFEEDTYNLRIWSHELDSALNEWCDAQKVANIAASHLCDVISSYHLQKLPLDVASYDIPAVTGRVSQNLNEIISWMELLVQQVGFCVQTPVKKAVTELDELVETMRPDYADALSNLADAEDRWARASRKDAPRRLEELNNDVFISKMSYHKLALRYCSRLNILQSKRYSELIEPLLMLLYAFKCFFNAGSDAFKKESLTRFLTQAQQQMLTIGKEAEKDKEECGALLQSLSDLSKSQKEMYYGEKPEYVLHCPHQYQQERVRASESVEKQGYLRIKLKSGLFTNNWEKYYVFTQGAKLMWQKADQLGGSLMLDLTTVPGTSAQIASDGVDRRFVFAVCLPPSEEDEAGSGGGAIGERKWLMQAKNSMDMYEWIDVINNLAGIQHKISEEQPKEVSSKGVELLKEGENGNKLERREVEGEGSEEQQRTRNTNKMKTTKKTSKDSTDLSDQRSSPTTTNSPLSPPSSSKSYSSSVQNMADMLTTQPIQFDLLSIGSDSQAKPPSKSCDGEGKLKEFDIRFLGCLEVLTDEGGDAIVQPAIEHLLKARRVHGIVESCALKMFIAADDSGLFLVDREQTDNVKAHFDFADIAFWLPAGDDEAIVTTGGGITDESDKRNSTDGAHQEKNKRNMIMGMVTRTRTDKTSRPTFMCCVLASDDGKTTAAEICHELTNALKKYMSDLTVNDPSSDFAAAEQHKESSLPIRDEKRETNELKKEDD